ncbi:RhoGEF domain protein [Legionella moravica]|uniref:RhoGEF domain n=1 Tax=Legionella moravica TaxID=39962 RepID=A0A378K5X9_9GAMM|nr:RhoGEF domain-containing protein [Legionella moravica]KTD31367.1 RhoGEF domain protein [Legionella moravica]STX63251.1 RhoGEF domain [Legionella moravica]
MISNRVIQEMLDTEKTYQTSLEQFSQATKQPFFAEGPEIFQKLATATQKFSELSEALHFNASVEMTQSLSNAELTQLRAERMNLIGQFFAEFKSYMSVYEEFLKIKYTSNDAPEQLPFKQLDTFLRRISTLDSASLLIQPLQRGPRYELLIKDVLKRDDELSPESPNKLSDEARGQLEILLNTTKGYLSEAAKREATPGYKFGDITRSLVRKGSELLSAAKSAPSAPENTSAQASGYKFGDYTRGFVSKAYSFWAPTPVAEISTPVLVSSSYSDTPAAQIPSAEPAVRTPPALPPRDMSRVSAVSLHDSDDDFESDDEQTFTFK